MHHLLGVDARCHVHVPSRMFVLTSNARLIVFRGRGVLNLQVYHVTFAKVFSKAMREHFYQLSLVFLTCAVTFRNSLYSSNVENMKKEKIE